MGAAMRPVSQWQMVQPMPMPENPCLKLEPIMANHGTLPKQESGKAEEDGGEQNETYKIECGGIY